MLQHAAAAHTEMRAARRHAVGRSLEDFLRPRFVEIPVLAHPPRAHALARQRIGYEHGLAVDARDTTAVVRKVVDASFEGDVARIAHPRILPDVSSGSIRTATLAECA